MCMWLISTDSDGQTKAGAWWGWDAQDWIHGKKITENEVKENNSKKDAKDSTCVVCQQSFILQSTKWMITRQTDAMREKMEPNQTLFELVWVGFQRTGQDWSDDTVTETMTTGLVFWPQCGTGGLGRGGWGGLVNLTLIVLKLAVVWTAKRIF